MADEPNIANAPLEITVTKKPETDPYAQSVGGAPAPIVPVDPETGDMGDQYLRMSQAESGRAARAILDRLSSGAETKPKPGAAGEGPAPSTPPVAAPESAGPPAAARSLGSRALSGAGDVVKDVGRGLTQAPRAIVQGAGEAVRQVFEATDHLSNWITDHVVDLNVPIPKTGSETADKLLAHPGQAIADMIPKMGESPDTVTGGIIHDASQFITGMAMGGKLLQGAGIMLGGFGKTAATGAFSDFAARDPDAAKLADLVQKYPALQNPVTDFMQAKPTDNEAVKRLKAAAEGVGMGALAEGFVLGAKAIRARGQAGSAVSDHGKLVQTMEQQAEAKYGKMSEEALALIGDPKAPMVKKLTEGQKASIAAKRIETGGKDMASGQGAQELANGLVKTADAGGNEVYVNFARINSSDDAKKVIGLMADAGKERIDIKRGGEKQTFKQMEDLAKDLDMDVTDLLSRRSGAPMSAAEAIAARSLLTASAERLTELATNIAQGTARPAEEFAFRRQMAIHAAIQSEVIAARTETARALASWNIPVGGGIEASRAISETLDAMGGSATTQELARRLTILNASGASIGAVSNFIRKGATARTIDAAMEAWKSAMLSGPTTHLANIFSNALTLGINVAERRVGAAISDARGTADGVAQGEMNAMAHGLVESSKDALRMAYRALRTGETAQTMANKTETTQVRAISKEALGLPDNVWGTAVDYIGKGFQVPFRLLMASDEFFKTIASRMELHAQAQRVATSEGLTGVEASARMRQIIENPPEVVRLAATDFALSATYQRELTGALATINRARSDDGTVGRSLQFILPFFKTPVNVFSAATERSPLAPLTAQFRADFKAGGARQDLALARMATGTTLMLITADLADQGLITGMGPKDPGAKEALERQGWQPYSVKINGKWVSYNRMDPMAMPLAISANMAELARRFEVEPDKLDSVREILAAGITGTAKAATDRSFMQGAASLMMAITDPDAHADAYVKNTIASFATPAISATAAQLADPVRRETFDAIDAIEARIIELSKSLIARRDLWGREIMLPESGAGRAFDVISPVKIQSEKPNPIDAEIVRLGVKPTRIDKRGSWDGAPVDFTKFPEVYGEYSRLAGNALAMPQYEDKGAMDFLNDLVEGKSGYADYWAIMSDGPEGGKAQFIQKVIGDYRKAARREIEADPRFSEFREYLVQQGNDAAVKKATTEDQRAVAPQIPRVLQMSP